MSRRSIANQTAHTCRFRITAMGGLDEALLHEIISHQVDLLRLDAGSRQQVLEILDRMQKELVAKLANEDLTDFGKQRTNALLKECTAIIDAYYTRAQGELFITSEALAPMVASAYRECDHGSGDAWMRYCQLKAILKRWSAMC
jgi:hypothetical protein